MNTRLYAAFSILAIPALLGVLLLSCGNNKPVRGFYTGGWEWSRFEPCGNLDDRWWIMGNEAFFARYDSLTRAEGYETHSGPAVYVEVYGTRSDTGRYGHMGQYTREFRITGVHTMEYCEDLQRAGRSYKSGICSER